jgi:hypothetical protein
MKEVMLQLELLSAATFGRGDGVAGLVDSEVEHDQDGFPFLRGRTLKGLLREAAEEIAFALEPQYDYLSDEAKSTQQWPWHAALISLFGEGSSDLNGQGILHIGDARIPEALRTLMLAERERSDGKIYHKDEILASFTGIRRQTAMNRFGGPEHGTLRSLRVILRDTILTAALRFTREPEEKELALLVGATLGLKAAGTGRNRGRGRLRATLNNDAFMRQHLARI